MSIQSKWVKFDGFSGYQALPERTNGAEEAPAVLLIQEIWGVDAHIRSVADRLAESGYAVLAPDLFFRDGAKPSELQEHRVEEVKRFLDMVPHTVWHDVTARSEELAKLPEPQRQAVSESLESVLSAPKKLDAFLEILQAGVRYLRGGIASSSNPRPVVSMGFCLGGALSARLALQDVGLKGAIVFYGNLPSPEQVPDFRCPVQGHFGGLDPRITDQVPAFAEAMEQHSKPFEYYIYKDAPHAFFNDTRASYRSEAAAQAWQRTLAFLKESATD